jgi:long-subunit fatty acid transport protein
MTYKAKLTIKNLSIGLLACAAVASVQAQAQTQTQPLPPVQNAAPAPSMAPALTGVYVVGNVGSTAITDLGSKIGFGGAIGYKINENFAVEAGAQSLGKYTVAGSDVSASALNVSVVGSVPLDPKFSVFGRLGYGSLTATANGSSAADTNSVLYGAGVRYNLNQNLAIRGEYTRLASDTGTFAVGLQFGF